MAAGTREGAWDDAPEDLRVQESETALWAAWKGAGDRGAREALITLHYDFARIMAGKMYARRATDEVGFEEYLQLASVALIESVDRYEPSSGASFRTYAGHRITGAILNGLAGMTERSRQIALKRRIERERLESIRDMHEADLQDTFERLAEVAVGLAIGFMLDNSSVVCDGEAAYSDNAYERVMVRQMRERIMARVAQLPEREATVIRYHYLQQLPFDEIGQLLGVTKGRVSQIHRKGLALLRKTLGEMDGLDVQL